MKKTVILLLLLTLGCTAVQAQSDFNPRKAARYWTLGLSSSTKYFFATYYPGGSNFGDINASLTFCLGPRWQLGGGVGIGGGVSTPQRYRDAEGRLAGSSQRNPYVIPVFARAKCMLAGRKAAGWFFNADAGYMFGYVAAHDQSAMNYYCAFARPSAGYQFGIRGSLTKISVGAGLDGYLEHRETECDPADRWYDPQLNFLLYATFDFGAGKKN